MKEIEEDVVYALTLVAEDCYILLAAFHGNNQAINMMAHLCGWDGIGLGIFMLSDSQRLFSI